MNRAASVLFFVAILGALGPALCGDPTASSLPSIETYLDYPTQTFAINAWGGVPGGTGVLNFLIVTGPTPGLIQVPVSFDASGEAFITIPFATLNTGFDLTVGIQLVALGTDGMMHSSQIWQLGVRNYIVTDPEVPPCPSCPTAPGSWVEFIPWPGTSAGPTYPHVTVAIHNGEERQGGQPMLALESGPAGSFPIN